MSIKLVYGYDLKDEIRTLFTEYTEYLVENDGKFKEYLEIQKYDDEHFILKTNAVVSDGLTKWVVQFGGKIKVKSPNDLIYDVKKKAEEIINNY